LVERLQQIEPVLGGLGGEHVGIPGVDRGDTGLAQRGVAGPGVLVGVGDDRDIARLHPPVAEGGAAGQQCRDVGG